MKERIEQYCIELYQQFYRAVTINSSYKFNPTKNDIKMIGNFVGLVGKRYELNSLGVEFFLNYTEYQFNRWLSSPLKYGERGIMFNMIYGKKALELFIETSNKDYKKPRFFRRINKNINSSLIKHCRQIGDRIFKLVDEVKTLSITEENNKKKHLNEDIGLEWCIQNTSLFHPESENCNECDYAQKCLKLLSVNYPNTYKRRIL